jgi:hypothetical protein
LENIPLRPTLFPTLRIEREEGVLKAAHASGRRVHCRGSGGERTHGCGPLRSPGMKKPAGSGGLFHGIGAGPADHFERDRASAYDKSLKAGSFAPRAPISFKSCAR